MRKIPTWLIIVVVIALLVAAKFIFLPKKSGTSAAGAQKKPAGIVAVNYYVAQMQEVVNDVYTTGKIGALNQVDIKPEVSGKVMNIYFKEGETVNKGQPIVRINDADLQAQLEKNKTQVALSKEKLDRLKKLLAVNGVSKEEYDIQENELAGFKADQAVILAQLAKVNITAPFTGVIGLRNVSEGAYVSPADIIASLVQTKPLFIEFSLPEKYSPMLKKGMEVQFSTDEVGAKTFTAQVYAIEPRIDENTRTLRGRAVYNGNETFYPGAFVKVYVDLGKLNSIMVPTQSIIPILKGQKVFVARNGKAEEARVTTGLRTADKIQVTNGLNVGDTILTTGLMSVKKDSKIKLIKAGS